MPNEKYIEDVMRTRSNDYEAIGKRLDDNWTLELLHAAIGMATEAAELLDMLKKHVYYGKDIDLINLEEELGDSNWYQALAISAARAKGHSTSFQQICDKNIAKLKKRYAGKFSETKAENRDLDAEREILESIDSD
jgi:NTP pyrophosphatase (non-canonical NTP hydrolase)